MDRLLLISTLAGAEREWRSATPASLLELLAVGIRPHHPPPPQGAFSVRPSNNHRHEAGHERCESPECQTGGKVGSARQRPVGIVPGGRGRERQAEGRICRTRVLWVFLWQCLSWLL